ncbi:ABC transporter ATP-binding protein [Calidithermus roseus]|uniref:Daunorubicin/doxorubicin resistance ATP-binding protein DrrA n=1 Tax=Calidithermus roseus TaxID=1644118 RepID=A0A399EPM9_9DEIN|nr:ABC transporter ATP-binding protein [Calidithermus roseus]RIH84091.1 Daunorubicin/doxorubicin resistance ATP-binding protein DrrA [Calidithermus roseus]
MNLYVIRELTKRYEARGVLANDAISLDIRQGEILGVFGPNGAGKTTFVRQITALLRPSSGRIELLGQDVVRHPAVVPRYVGFFGQRAPILRNYTVAEVLVYAGVLRGLPAARARRQAHALIDRFELGAIAGQRLAQLSGGQARLPTLLATFMGDPRGVVLDEPTNELDPANRSRLWQFLDELRAQHGVTVVLTSHNLAEAERYVERAAFIDRGRLVALGTPGELKRAVANLVRLEIRIREPFLASVEPRLRGLPGSRSPKPGFWELTATPEEADRLLGRVVALVGLEALDDFRLVTPSMDDVYLRLTSGAAGPGVPHAG